MILFRKILLVSGALFYFILQANTQSQYKKTRIYEDDFFHVDNMQTKDKKRTIRLFGPNLLGSEFLNHGYIQLENTDHIAVPYIRLLLGSLYLQQTRTPKRILFIGLGIGILPRALNLILKDTAHIDVVEIGIILVKNNKK